MKRDPGTHSRESFPSFFYPSSWISEATKVSFILFLLLRRTTDWKKMSVFCDFSEVRGFVGERRMNSRKYREFSQVSFPFSARLPVPNAKRKKKKSKPHLPVFKYAAILLFMSQKSTPENRLCPPRYKKEREIIRLPSWNFFYRRLHMQEIRSHPLPRVYILWPVVKPPKKHGADPERKYSFI